MVQRSSGPRKGQWPSTYGRTRSKAVCPPFPIGTSADQGANFRRSSPSRSTAYAWPFCRQHAAVHRSQGLSPRMAKRNRGTSSGVIGGVAAGGRGDGCFGGVIRLARLPVGAEPLNQRHLVARLV